MSRRIARCGAAIALLVVGVLRSGFPRLRLRGWVANPDDTLTYEPYGLVHQLHSAAKVDGYLSDLDSYGVGQALLQTPRFKNTRGSQGSAQRPHHARRAGRSEAAAYNAAHGTHITVTAVFNGQVRTTGAGLDLDNPETRASMIDGITSVLTTGVSGVHLDLEPFPMTHGLSPAAQGA